MLAALVVVLRALALICCGHRAVALENLALRQQLEVFRRTSKRPQLCRRDRVFWMLLANAWRDWRTALIVVQPDTVVRWHRQWLQDFESADSSAMSSGRSRTSAMTTPGAPAGCYARLSRRDAVSVTCLYLSSRKSFSSWGSHGAIKATVGATAVFPLADEGDGPHE